MFLSTETKEKVEAGIAFFKESLQSLYDINYVDRLIFYCDKDFDISGKQHVEGIEAIEKPKRVRPKGSKNKKKGETAPPATKGRPKG